MKRVLLYLWQLPQNLLGLILSRVLKTEYRFEYGIKYYAVNGFFYSGVSLGKYILIDNAYLLARKTTLENVLKHELGHQKQSLCIGWFYLLVVGIPSLCRNIYARITKKDNKWYFSGFPENWADKLGNVNRSYW